MGRIFFVCPDHNKPAGGIKQLYRQVEVLNKNNVEASILHGRKPFRINWFETKVPVVWDKRVCLIDKPKKRYKSLRQMVSILKNNVRGLQYSKDTIDFETDDIIVLPEFYGKSLDFVFQNQSVVIYNQNCYYTFRGYDYNEFDNNSIYQQNRLKAVIVASEDAKKYLGIFLNDKPLFRVKYGIDHKVFSYSGNKKKQIAFMPRKLKEDSIQIFNILSQNKVLQDWKIVPIDNLNEQEVAGILMDSVIFLSFNHREGFGMPPAEAMACGCIVIGYAGQGGEEYLLPEYAYPIKDRDIISFVNTITEVIKLFDKNQENLIAKGKRASDFIFSNYSLNQEEETIMDVWSKILKKS